MLLLATENSIVSECSLEIVSVSATSYSRLNISVCLLFCQHENSTSNNPTSTSRYTDE